MRWARWPPGCEPRRHADGICTRLLRVVLSGYAVIQVEPPPKLPPSWPLAAGATRRMAIGVSKDLARNRTSRDALIVRKDEMNVERWQMDSPIFERRWNG